MDDVLDIIWIIVALGLAIAKMARKSGKADDEEETAEEVEAEISETSEGEAPAQFVYYTDRQGLKRVDVNESNALSGRELTEYEIFCENKRLEAQFAESLPEVPKPEWPEVKPPEYGEEISLEELGRRPVLEGSGEDTVRSDAEYQLQQLERWLDAGLIDKAEYRRRKREIK